MVLRKSCYFENLEIYNFPNIVKKSDNSSEVVVSISVFCQKNRKKFGEIAFF